MVLMPWEGQTRQGSLLVHMLQVDDALYHAVHAQHRAETYKQYLLLMCQAHLHVRLRQCSRVFRLLSCLNPFSEGT